MLPLKVFMYHIFIYIYVKVNFALLQIICVCWCQQDQSVINNTGCERARLHLFTISGLVVILLRHYNLIYATVVRPPDK